MFCPDFNKQYHPYGCEVTYFGDRGIGPSIVSEMTFQSITDRPSLEINVLTASASDISVSTVYSKAFTVDIRKTLILLLQSITFGGRLLFAL